MQTNISTLCQQQSIAQFLVTSMTLLFLHGTSPTGALLE